MADQHSHEAQGPTEHELQESIAAGYEKDDISLSVLIRWAFILAGFLVATAAAMLLLFAFLQHSPFAPGAPGESIIPRQPLQSSPTMPIVQDNPAGDPRPDNNPRKGIDNIREFRREEEIRMNEYATQGSDIHIPIDRAMELSLKDFAAQKPGEAPTGVSPTAEMKLHPDTSTAAPKEGKTPVPQPAAKP